MRILGKSQFTPRVTDRTPSVPSFGRDRDSSSTPSVLGIHPMYNAQLGFGLVVFLGSLSLGFVSGQAFGPCNDQKSLFEFQSHWWAIFWTCLIGTLWTQQVGI